MGHTELVLIIRSSPYQDIAIHVQYYSKPNRDWKPVCVKQKLVLGVFFLTRTYLVQPAATDVGGSSQLQPTWVGPASCDPRGWVTAG